jgi:hypothetical protein
MKLFKRSNKQPERQRQRQTQPLAGQRMRDPQRQSGASMGQNRTFSYYAARSQADFNTGREAVQDKPPLRRLPTRFQRLRKHSGWLAGLVLVVAIVVYELQLSTTPHVVSLASSSDVPFLQETKVYQVEASKMFSETASNRNKLTVNATDIGKRLQQKFPELQSASVSLPLLGNTPTVYIKPAEPAMVLAATNGTYVVGDNGRTLTEVTAGTNLDRLHIPSVTDQSGLSVKVGEQVLPRSAAAFISTVATQLASQKITVQSMTLPAAAGELDVYVTGKPYFVKFNVEKATEDNALQQVGTLIAVLKKLEKDGKAPGQYVDVRLAGRAYYK